MIAILYLIYENKIVLQHNLLRNSNHINNDFFKLVLSGPNCITIVYIILSKAVTRVFIIDFHQKFENTLNRLYIYIKWIKKNVKKKSKKNNSYVSLSSSYYGLFRKYIKHLVYFPYFVYIFSVFLIRFLLHCHFHLNFFFL